MKSSNAASALGVLLGSMAILLLLPLHAQGKVDTIRYAPGIDSSRFWYGDGDRLEWSSVPGADSYDVQISETPDFSDGTIEVGEEVSGPAPALVRDVRGIRNRWYELDIDTGGTYYWRVRGVDEFGVPGPWSAASGFQLQVSSVLAPDAIGLTVGPNPCADCLYRIQAEGSPLVDLAVYDVIGRPVLTQEFSGGTADAALDLSPLAGGVYHILTTQADGTVAVHRVVIR